MSNLRELLLYEKKAEIFKSLANPVRLEILDVLIEGEKCVQQITGQLKKYEQPHISKNLAKLKNAGIIKDRKAGLKVYYSISMRCIRDFLVYLNKTL